MANTDSHFFSDAELRQRFVEAPTISNEELGLTEKDIKKIVERTWSDVRNGHFKIIYNAEKDDKR